VEQRFMLFNKYGDFICMVKFKREDNDELIHILLVSQGDQFVS
jgi:hypothetical protein